MRSDCFQCVLSCILHLQQPQLKSVVSEPLTSHAAIVDTSASDAAAAQAAQAAAQAAAQVAALQLQVAAAEAAAAAAESAAAASAASAAAATASSAQLQTELAKAKDELGEFKARAENEHIRLAQANVQKQFLQSQIAKLQTQVGFRWRRSHTLPSGRVIVQRH